ncbi:hypothetical protein D3C81_809920 [compost metagenome]
MAVGAEIDEGSFEAGFDAGDAALVDVGLFLLAGARFDVEVEQALAVDQGNAQLFGLSCVDQHSFHVVPMVSGLPETAVGTHDSRGRCQVRRERSGRCPCQASRTAGSGCDWRLLLTVGTEALIQEEESNNAADDHGVWKAECYAVRRLCISTLHVSLRIGCRSQNPQRVSICTKRRASRTSCLKAGFPRHRLTLADAPSDGLASINCLSAVRRSCLKHAESRFWRRPGL